MRRLGWPALAHSLLSRSLDPGGTVIRTIFLSAWLVFTWLLWSGHSEPLLLAFGALSVGIAVLLALRMDLIDAESEPYHLGLRPLLYIPWLLWEIAKANLHVARVILTPSLPIRPRLLRIRARQETDLGRVIFANSITLTPGTVTLDVRDQTLLVHALTRHSADGLLNGGMNDHVAWLEGAESDL